MAQPAQPSSEAVQQQQARQQELTGMLAASLLSAWATVDVTDLAGTLPRFKLTVAGLVRKYGQSSAVLAARFYQQERAAAGVSGRHAPALADPAGLEQVQKSVGWATKGLWAIPKVPQDVAAAPAAPGPVDVPALVSNAQALVKGVAQKMVVDTGRNTLIEAIEADRKARGWAREARPDGCYFCAMLSTRGAVYKTEQTASFEPHNNCVVPGTLVSGPNASAGFRRHYEGELISLITAAGYKLAITPKHPVLTARGWVPAGLLNEGDDLVSSRSLDRNALGGPDVDHVPARIEDVVGSLGMMLSSLSLSVPGTAEQFHGDGFAAEVNVVVADYLLRYEIDSALSEQRSEYLFPVATVPCSFGSPECPGLSEAQPGLKSFWPATDGIMGSRSERSPFGLVEPRHPGEVGLLGTSTFDAQLLNPASRYSAGYSVYAGEREFALARGVPTGEIGRHWDRRLTVGVARKFDPPTFNRDAETLGVFTKLGTDLRERLSGAVHLDRLVYKGIGQHHGDVLNVETQEGWYSANGITVSNCHCMPVPVFADRYEPPAHVREWEQIYRDSTRGKSNAAARNAFRVALAQHRATAPVEAPVPALV